MKNKTKTTKTTKTRFSNTTDDKAVFVKAWANHVGALYSLALNPDSDARIEIVEHIGRLEELIEVVAAAKFDKDEGAANLSPLDQINAQLEKEEKKQDALREKINASLHTWTKLKGDRELLELLPPVPCLA